MDYLDDNQDKASAYPVIGSMEDIVKYSFSYENAIVALGNNQNRAKYHSILEKCGYNIPILVHPNAYVSPDEQLVLGCIARTFAVVGRYAELGKAVILNIGCKVDHHCVIGDYSHLLINSVVRVSKYVSIHSKQYIFTIFCVFHRKL